ncbi:protease modulator HflK [Lutimaribacter sp. EGI FJ00015]|uniref:Protease modulator HflK n=1 Tax=Lutimaribacter degradans TaxID=2945989 RepID=A0ACC5ZTJ9_9RHOB|nr:protease modulator HflK [Lutimaribacter sp. EGI FJ00013]MCM2561273.1 protease modulator HflK [Lutimaribacter sp. EGI FJ00013]MCO0611776.1 protease modulator HflK [Lutimaribacter sp. EGI FJ00015]MCO0635102.1 protease modulator HflK [Lutimaribacter sp. EGI FJ00014]
MPSDDNGPGDAGPWKQQHKRGPPEIHAIPGRGRAGLNEMLPGGSPQVKRVVFGLLIALVAVGAWSSYSTVPSDYVAIVQRFGKYSAEVPPGLHFKNPIGIDATTQVPVKRQFKQEFGFTTPGATDPYQSPTDGRRESEIVTADLDAALVERAMQSRISEPRKLLFEVREPSVTLRYVSESVMRAVVGERTVDEVITVGRQEIEREVLLKMQELTTKYAMRIGIDQVQLKNINPPQPVLASFNEAEGYAAENCAGASMSMRFPWSSMTSRGPCRPMTT